MRRLTALMLIAFSVGCWQAAPDPGLIEAELLQADREFALATAERRLDGWMSYFAEDSAKIEPGGGVVRGTEAIRSWDSSIFAEPSTDLRWEPTEAGAFRDADHGFTVGNYEMIRTADDGTETVMSSGHYLSIWRREGDGWKVILDTSLPGPSSAG